MSAATTVAEVLALFRRAGDRRYDGEPVSHREHALQCATMALEQRAPTALVAACLLHDVGHWLADSDVGSTPTLAGHDDRHEVAGPAWLAALFGGAVLMPIRWHVDAKRFLAATEPGYLEALTADSRRSLALQGGPLDVAAQRRFCERPLAAEAVHLRRFDDLAKQPGRLTLPMERFARLLERCTRNA